MSRQSRLGSTHLNSTRGHIGRVDFLETSHLEMKLWSVNRSRFSPRVRTSGVYASSSLLYPFTCYFFQLGK